MDKELNEILIKIQELKEKRIKLCEELNQIKEKYNEEIKNINELLNNEYSRIFSNKMIKVSVEELIEELEMINNDVNIKSEVLLGGFFIVSLNENEEKAEAFEKIKKKYRKNQLDDMCIRGYDIKTKNIIYDFRLPSFKMNVDVILSDGSKLIDNFTHNDICISKNTIFGEKSGIITIPQEILLKTILVFPYEDLDNDYDEDFYPNVKMLKDAILNILNKNSKNINTRK